MSETTQTDAPAWQAFLDSIMPRPAQRALQAIFGRAAREATGETPAAQE